MQLTKFISSPKEDVFDAFIDAQKLEKWCYPVGFSLKVPLFEAREGGSYRYKHIGPEGEYNCTGSITELRPNEKLVSVDDQVIGPEGNILYENLKSSVSFRDKKQGTELNIIQEGFKDAEAERNCEQGWVECLNNLENYLASTSDIHRDVGHGESINPS